MRVLIIIMAIVALSCNKPKKEMELEECMRITYQVMREADSLYARDSIIITKQFELIDRQNRIISNLNDSFDFYRNAYLKSRHQQALSKDNFIKIYKYERLYKYYRICKRNPSQWKYYKGWSTRVFEK